MQKRRKMTAAERRRFNAIKARVAARKLAEDTEVEDVEDMDETQEEAERGGRRRAFQRNDAERAYRAYIASQRRKRAQEEDEGTPEQPAADIEPELDEEDEKEAMRRRALARARRVAASGRTRRRKRAQEASDDLIGPDGDSSHIEQLGNDGEHVSDDLADPDEGDGGIEQAPPASADEAEEKVLAAYNLIDKQVANKVVAANVHRASLARKYCRKYTAKQMKLMAQQLGRVGSVKKASGNVRVTRRGSGIQNKRTASSNQMDSSILFY